MLSNNNQFIPYIPKSKYDDVAREFLERYYPAALASPCRVPIEKIAEEEVGLNIQYIGLSEELDIYGITIFTDGLVDIYDHDECLYETRAFKAKTVLIDPHAIEKTTIGCKNNTIAHECVHWYKHRYFHMMQTLTLPKYARYCKCRIDQLPSYDEEENIMEAQAVGIAPRILMPQNTFIEAAEELKVSYGKDNRSAISSLAEFFDVSKQSVCIRLKECNLL